MISRKLHDWNRLRLFKDHYHYHRWSFDFRVERERDSLVCAVNWNRLRKKKVKTRALARYVLAAVVCRVFPFQRDLISVSLLCGARSFHIMKLWVFFAAHAWLENMPLRQQQQEMLNSWQIVSILAVVGDHELGWGGNLMLYLMDSRNLSRQCSFKCPMRSSRLSSYIYESLVN